MMLLYKCNLLSLLMVVLFATNYFDHTAFLSKKQTIIVMYMRIVDWL